jgi:hypothetical protein
MKIDEHQIRCVWFGKSEKSVVLGGSRIAIFRSPARTVVTVLTALSGFRTVYGW